MFFREPCILSAVFFYICVFVHTHRRLYVSCIFAILLEHGEYVVVLADTMLLELPLEALTVLQGSGISSISRDISLQVFHTRLLRDKQGKTAAGCLHLKAHHYTNCLIHIKYMMFIISIMSRICAGVQEVEKQSANTLQSKV